MTGGCSGMMVGESIFHDDVVASPVGKRHSLLPRPPTIPYPVSPLAASTLAFRTTRDCNFRFYETEGSILFKIQADRYFAGVSTSVFHEFFHPLSRTLQSTRVIPSSRLEDVFARADGRAARKFWHSRRYLGYPRQMNHRSFDADHRFIVPTIRNEK